MSQVNSYASRNGKLRLITYTLEYYTQYCSIQIQNRAAVRGSLPDVQKALDNGANPDCTTNLLVYYTITIIVITIWHHRCVQSLVT